MNKQGGAKPFEASLELGGVALIGLGCAFLETGLAAEVEFLGGMGFLVLAFGKEFGFGVGIVGVLVVATRIEQAVVLSADGER